jgi:hypothetical protein
MMLYWSFKLEQNDSQRPDESDYKSKDGWFQRLKEWIT